MNYDLAIIGGGSAAFAAAIHARRKDLRVVMVERGEIGGTCVNVGCIPSKALLAAAEARHVAETRRFPGIDTAAAPVLMEALIAGKDAIVRDLRQDKYLDLAREYDWEIVRGGARFAPGPALEVDGRTIQAKHYLIATGSKPWTPPIDGLADAGYLTSTTAIELDAVPESLIVIGGNYIGLELGQLFAYLGSNVTIVEALDRIAPHEEPEISKALDGILRDEGIALHTSATVIKVQREADGVSVSVDAARRSQQFRASQLVVATFFRDSSHGPAPQVPNLHRLRNDRRLQDRAAETAVRDCGLGSGDVSAGKLRIENGAVGRGTGHTDPHQFRHAVPVRVVPSGAQRPS